MERFRKYMGSELNIENIKDESSLNGYGVKCTYLPDPVEEFDEFEFRTDFNGQQNIVITITIELGKIQRVMFGEADENNPDVVRSLTGEQLESFLSQKGDQMTGFFDFICVLL
jgi:hypothetical protein